MQAQHLARIDPSSVGATSGASPVHCCQGWKRRARGAWDKMTRGVAGERQANSRASHRRCDRPDLKDRSAGNCGGKGRCPDPAGGKPRHRPGEPGLPAAPDPGGFPPRAADPLPRAPPRRARAGPRGFLGPKSRASGRPRWARSPAKSTNSGGGDSEPISATARARASASGRRGVPVFRLRWASATQRQAQILRARRPGARTARPDPAPVPSPRPGPAPPA